MDDQGLTIFDTLHELQDHACKAYESNELFGTFTPTHEGELGGFTWMTYGDFAEKVNKTRAVLKDIGT